MKFSKFAEFRTAFCAFFVDVQSLWNHQDPSLIWTSWSRQSTSPSSFFDFDNCSHFYRLFTSLFVGVLTFFHRRFACFTLLGYFELWMSRIVPHTSWPLSSRFQFSSQLYFLLLALQEGLKRHRKCDENCWVIEKTAKRLRKGKGFLTLSTILRMFLGMFDGFFAQHQGVIVGLSTVAHTYSLSQLVCSVSFTSVKETSSTCGAG